jgi:hypothetical protein
VNYTAFRDMPCIALFGTKQTRVSYRNHFLGRSSIHSPAPTIRPRQIVTSVVNKL